MPETEQTYDVVATRRLPVTPHEAWRVWTEPGLVRQWWCPGPFTCPVAVLDVREGGTSLLGMRAPAEMGGATTYTSWTYTLVDAPHELRHDLRFVDADGHHLGPAASGLDGVPDPVPHLVTFEPTDDGTRLTVIERGYTTEASRDLSAAGLEACLDKVDALTRVMATSG